MKLTRDEFKRLQQYWYNKLAETGFKDIERMTGDELILIKSSSQCYGCVDEHTRMAKEEYYVAMAKIALDDHTVYRNHIDRYILQRHVEGARIKVIVEELEAMGSPRHRHSIRFIIRRYEMAWGFRHYTNPQLNIKKIA